MPKMLPAARQVQQPADHPPVEARAALDPVEARAALDPADHLPVEARAALDLADLPGWRGPQPKRAGIPFA